MKLHFDSKQEFQLEAVKAITDIFEGQPLSNKDFEFSISQTGELLSENGFGNKLRFSELTQLTGNIQQVQKNNGLKISSEDESSVTGGIFRLKWKPAPGKRTSISAQFMN